MKKETHDIEGYELDKKHGNFGEPEEYAFTRLFADSVRNGQLMQAEGIAYEMGKESILEAMGLTVAAAIEEGESVYLDRCADILQRVFVKRFHK